MRTFIAIEVDEEIKEGLAKIQDELKIAQADVKWVEPKNIHLTLKFLGEVGENKIPAIIQALKDAARQTKSFSIALTNLGAFPSLKSPRVIWIGSENGSAELLELANLIEALLVKLGFPGEKREFSCHLTLGRAKSSLNKESLSEKISQIKFGSPLRQDVKSIVIFKSTLTPKGPIYEKLAEENLKTQAVPKNNLTATIFLRNFPKKQTPQDPP